MNVDESESESVGDLRGRQPAASSYEVFLKGVSKYVRVAMEKKNFYELSMPGCV